jgi:hypothetical protein
MVAVFAREVTVNGTTYPAGHRADTVGLREDRFQQMVNLKRIVDSEDPGVALRFPGTHAGDVMDASTGGQVILTADAQGVITGAVPVPDSPIAVAPPPEADDDGMNLEGLWPCRVEDCNRELGSERARDNHEKREHAT